LQTRPIDAAIDPLAELENTDKHMGCKYVVVLLNETLLLALRLLPAQQAHSLTAATSG
jgi:hypothetical protein